MGMGPDGGDTAVAEKAMVWNASFFFRNLQDAMVFKGLKVCPSNVFNEWWDGRMLVLAGERIEGIDDCLPAGVELDYIRYVWCRFATTS